MEYGGVYNSNSCGETKGLINTMTDVTRIDKCL